MNLILVSVETGHIRTVLLEDVYKLLCNSTDLNRNFKR